MKIIDILNKIANGENAPKKIHYKNNIYEYVEEEKDYVNEVFGNDWLFDSHIVTDILNDEVEILETTITYKQDANYLKPQEPTPYEPYIPPKKIEKLEFDFKLLDETDFINKYPRISYMIERQKNKINEIIDYIYKE